jgi:hypothetical protein
MDSLFWTNLNPKIVCEDTRKQFYGQFCYKLVIEAHGSRSITETRPDDCIANHLADRRSKQKHINYGGSWATQSTWAQRQADELKKSDPVFLEELRSIKNGYGNRIRMRIEEPWLQIYTRDEQTLKDIAARLNHDQTIASRLLSVSTPASPEQQTLLEAGHIIAAPNSKQEYKYKIVLRDGSYSMETKQSIVNYLKTMGNEVKVSAANMNMLSGPLKYIWGCFVYTNDPSITTMIGLIAPGMVGKIHEIVKL